MEERKEAMKEEEEGEESLETGAFSLPRFVFSLLSLLSWRSRPWNNGPIYRGRHMRAKSY